MIWKSKVEINDTDTDTFKQIEIREDTTDETIEIELQNQHNSEWIRISKADFKKLISLWQS